MQKCCRNIQFQRFFLDSSNKIFLDSETVFSILKLFPRFRNIFPDFNFFSRFHNFFLDFIIFFFLTLKYFVDSKIFFLILKVFSRRRLSATIPFFHDIKIYFHSIKTNLYSVRNIFCHVYFIIQIKYIFNI